MTDKTISEGDMVVKSDDPLRQVIRVTSVDERLRGTYLLPNRQAAHVNDEPVEHYRLATEEEIRGAAERGQLPAP